MKIEILVGDVLDIPADVLISTANPWLQMTGGVNLAIILRPQGELVHEELQRYLRASGNRYVDPGTVVCTGPGSLPVKHIVHAVSLDPSYESSVELVAATIVKALAQMRKRSATCYADGGEPAILWGTGFALVMNSELMETTAVHLHFQERGCTSTRPIHTRLEDGER